MDLRSYLEAINVCPDDKLAAEHGIHDNHPLFLNWEFQKLLLYLNQCGKYEQKDIVDQGKGYYTYQFNYLLGTVYLQVDNYVSPNFTSGKGETEEEIKHEQRQLKDYNLMILLHPYQKKKIPQINDVRALTTVIMDICSMALRESVPLCLPFSKGWEHQDLSRIVYFP